jgi:hypothetical protein
MIEPGQQITFSLMKEQLEKEIGYALDFEREDTLRSHLSTLCIEDDSCLSSSDSKNSLEGLDEHTLPGEHLARSCGEDFQVDGVAIDNDIGDGQTCSGESGNGKGMRSVVWPNRTLFSPPLTSFSFACS